MLLQKLKFSQKISAPKEKVWKVLLEDKTYREWTSVFSEGSHYKGNWNEGSRIFFLSPEGEGMASRIKKHIPNEIITIEHLGMVNNGVEDYESETGKQWKGAEETYMISEENGKSLLRVETDTTSEHADFFTKTWPKALEKVKELAEEQGN